MSNKSFGMYIAELIHKFGPLPTPIVMNSEQKEAYDNHMKYLNKQNKKVTYHKNNKSFNRHFK